MALDEIRQTKIDKTKLLRKAGVDPYPAKSWRTHSIAQVLDNFNQWVEGKERLALAGRIISKREHGASLFLDLEEATGRIQVYLKKDVVGEYDFDLFMKTVDVGDFLETAGFLFKTKKGEPTLEAEKYRILGKALLPLPEKWHGLQDVEERFRKRYLDLLFNPEVKEKFEKKATLIKSLRGFLDQHGFMEVTTPILQPLYGGASARPFKTHLHTLDLDLYLRIAPELYLKRLLVGGFEKIYEFSTNFRNEGMDREHNPEFFSLEFYAAYQDLDWIIKFTEELMETVVKKVLDKTNFEYQGQKVDFARPYKVEKFNDLLKRHTGLDYDYADEDTLVAKAKELGLTIEKYINRGVLADEIFKKYIRPKLINPTFVTAWPAAILPLAKKIGETDYVETFQFFAGGLELIKAFSELNDPLEQRERFKAQEKNRAKGDEEAQPLDEDFLEALEYGMPPAAGLGLGIDRLAALLTNSHSVREVILFPLMKPRPE